MRVRVLLTGLAAVVLLAVALIGPVAGSSELEVAEVVDADLSGLPAATDADGATIVDEPDDDPQHRAHVDELRASVQGPDDPHGDAHGDAPGDHDGHDHGEFPLGAPGGVRSEAVTTPIVFSMVAFTIPEGTGVSFRTRPPEGEWDDWYPVHVNPDEGPDHDDEVEGDDVTGAGEQGRWVSEPFWVGAADEIQLRVDGADPAEIDVHLVDSLGQNRGTVERVSDSLQAVARAVTGAGRQAAAAIDQPDIITRQEWGADESRRRGTPRYAKQATTGVLHHTATGNDYDRSEAASVVRAIYHFHTGPQRNWSDIGYNFLVDRFGNVYEGRAGGVDEPVIGAHVAGYNTGSIGVAFMGNHGSRTGTSLETGSEKAAAELLTWLFDVHHIDAEADSDIGDRTGVPSLVGHGDLGSTDCPGGYVRQRLDPVRAAIVDGQEAMFTGPSADAELSFGDELDVTAGLKPQGRWEFTLIGPDDGVVHRESGWGDEAAVTWRATAAGAYEWELTSPGRRPVTGEVGVMDELAERVGGDGPMGGAVALSKEAFPETDTASHAVVARADVFADAMAGGPLAGSDGPLLLTPSSELDHDVGRELERVLPETATVYVLGGQEAISDDVVEAIEKLGEWTVERFAGRERTETAGLIAEEVLVRTGADQAMLARSAPDDINPWADALAGSAWGAHSGVPVLLTPTEQLTAKPEAVLEQVSQTIVLGGTSAISTDVADQVPGARRVAGSTRAGTAVAIAEQLWRRTAGADDDAFIFGAGWEDGAWQRTLAAAPLAGREGAPLLLTASDEVPGSTADYLRGLGYGGDRRGRGWVLENHPVIETSTFTELNLLLQ